MGVKSGPSQPTPSWRESGFMEVGRMERTAEDAPRATRLIEHGDPTLTSVLPSW